MRTIARLTLAAAMAAALLPTSLPGAGASPFAAAPAAPLMSERPDIHLVQRRTCRSARSCREAVAMWCGGYFGADGDGDGIPCEIVCRSRAQVNEIRREIGC